MKKMDKPRIVSISEGKPTEVNPEVYRKLNTKEKLKVAWHTSFGSVYGRDKLKTQANEVINKLKEHNKKVRERVAKEEQEEKEKQLNAKPTGYGVMTI